jgi:hypothetical protein
MPKYAMADGRAFTDYRPNCQLNEKLQQGSGMNNAREYRMYLQQNAAPIMQTQQGKAQARHKAECHCPNCQRDAAMGKK